MGLSKPVFASAILLTLAVGVALGPPIFRVYVTNFPSSLHETYEWGSSFEVSYAQPLWITNETRGFKQVTIAFKVYEDVLRVTVYFRNAGQPIEFDGFTVAYEYYKTYQIQGPELLLCLQSTYYTVRFFISIYMTT